MLVISIWPSSVPLRDISLRLEDHECDLSNSLKDQGLCVVGLRTCVYIHVITTFTG